MIDISRLSPSELDRFLHLQAIVDRQEQAQATVRSLRDYYYGSHPILLTVRQQEFLGPLIKEPGFSFAHNLVRTVVDTLRERLSVTGFTINGQAAGDEEEAGPEAQLAARLWQWWNANRMDSQQIRCHRRALRDGKTYAIVDYDTGNQRPRINLHKVDDGTTGVTFHRDPTDQNKVLFAARYFYTYDPLQPGVTGIARKTVYLPGEIRKYIRRANGMWEPTTDPEDNGVWPLLWRDRDGQPLGVAVIEFANPGGSEMMQIIGLQNAVNKSWLDVMAGADSSGFPILVTEYEPGGMPPDSPDDDIEGTDETHISPGRMIEVEGRIHRIEGANLTPMLDVVWALVQAISGVSRTPAYYLRPVGGSDVPSGEALKQLESGLVQRAEERQLMFGQAWADVMEMCIKVARAFGSAQVPEIDDLDIATTWEDATTRNELVQGQTAQLHQSLNVPDEQIWALLGYEPDQIAEFKQRARAERMTEVAAIAESLRVGQQRNAPQTQPQQFRVNGNGNGN